MHETITLKNGQQREAEVRRTVFGRWYAALVDYPEAEAWGRDHDQAIANLIVKIDKLLSDLCK